jgi:hypothetical protein
MQTDENMTGRNARARSDSDDAQKLEAERLRRTPRNPGRNPEPIDALFTQLLDLITAECRRAGMLPRRGRALAPCGTWNAYRRHLRHYEPACDACRKAASAYVAGRRAARKAEQEATTGGTA